MHFDRLSAHVSLARLAADRAMKPTYFVVRRPKAFPLGSPQLGTAPRSAGVVDLAVQLAPWSAGPYLKASNAGSQRGRQNAAPGGGLRLRSLSTLCRHWPVRRGDGSRALWLRSRLLVQAADLEHVPMGVSLQAQLVRLKLRREPCEPLRPARLAPHEWLACSLD